jgi:transposase
VIAVQMGWLWLSYQSKSELSLWYYSRVGDLKGRVRRIMIIALARKLVIALKVGKIPASFHEACARRKTSRGIG